MQGRSVGVEESFFNRPVLQRQGPTPAFPGALCLYWSVLHHKDVIQAWAFKGALFLAGKKKYLKMSEGKIGTWIEQTAVLVFMRMEAGVSLPRE